MLGRHRVSVLTELLDVADDTRMPTPEAFAALVKTELVRFANVVKAAGIRIE